jgi:uncharacterized protein (UPF0548 family)
MFFLSRPTVQRIDRFRVAAEQDTYSYPQIGATAKDVFPKGYNVDHNRIRLGQGVALFHRAHAALEVWKMFDLGWVKLIHPEEPAAPGQTILILARTFGLYSLSASRIIEIINTDDGRTWRRGFNYGTLHITWNAARSGSASNTATKMTPSGMTCWRFRFPGTHWRALVTRYRALLSGASR